MTSPVTPHVTFTVKSLQACRRCATLVVLPALLLSACGGPRTETTVIGRRAEAPARAVPMVTISRGPDTGYRTSSGAVESRVIETSAEWRRFWSEHETTGATPPAVDFSREQVLAVFAGDCPSEGHSLRIRAVLERHDGSREVRYERARPGPGDSPRAVPTRPFHLIRAPRSSGPVAFLATGDVESLSGHGELITGAGRPQLLSPDGHLTPIRSDAPFVDAGGTPGQTFRYVAIRRGAELELESLQLDDVTLRARVTAGGALVDRAGRPIAIQGSLPAAIQGLRADAPVRVCGLRQGPMLEITAAWPVQLFEVRRAGGLLGLDERLELELVTGRLWWKRSRHGAAVGEHEARFPMADLGYITGLIQRADLAAAPATFPARIVIADAPKVTLGLRDGARDVQVRVEPGSHPPAEIMALLTEAGRLMDDLRQTQSP